MDGGIGGEEDVGLLNDHGRISTARVASSRPNTRVEVSASRTGCNGMRARSSRFLAMVKVETEGDDLGASDMAYIKLCLHLFSAPGSGRTILDSHDWP